MLARRIAVSRVAIAGMACLGVLSVAGVAQAAPKKERITQESCQAQGGVYSESRGTRTCRTTTSATPAGPITRVSQNCDFAEYAPNPATEPPYGYFCANVYQQQTATTTTTRTQRGNQAPTETRTRSTSLVESRDCNTYEYLENTEQKPLIPGYDLPLATYPSSYCEQLGLYAG